MRHLPIKPTSAVGRYSTIMPRPIAVGCATTTRFACLLPSRSFKLDSCCHDSRPVSRCRPMVASFPRWRPVARGRWFWAGSPKGLCRRVQVRRKSIFKRGKPERLPCFSRSLVFLFTSSRSMLDLSPQIGDNAACLSKASCQPILIGIFGETPCWGENERDLLWSSCWW